MAGKIKWAGLDAALRDGSNDLSEDPEWQELNAELGSEKVSLARLITKLGYRDKLTISLIKETLDAYRAAHGGENPTLKSGAITEGPLAGKATWSGLDHALPKGSRGLSEDPEWQKLNAELGNGKVTLANLITKLGYRDKLTMALIKETIEAYRAAHSGENPTARLGAITEGPLAGKITWRALDSALSRGYNGLSEDPEWQVMNKKYQGKFSLFLLCKEFYKVPDITPVVLLISP